MESGLEFVIGLPRAGKSTYVASKVVEEDMTYLNPRYTSAVKYLKAYCKLHNLQLTLPPQNHVVFSNIDILNDMPKMKSYVIHGYEFGGPTKWQKTKRLLPYGVYVFDECQRIWPSKDNFVLPPWVTDAFELRGHIHLKIYLIAQKFKKLHSDIRGIVDVFTLIKKSVHTYLVNGKKIKSRELLDYGNLIQTTYYGVHFEDEASVDLYLKGDHSLGEEFIRVSKLDIRKHINSYAFAEEIQDSDYDFDYYETSINNNSKPEAWTLYKKALKKQEEKIAKESK